MRIANNYFFFNFISNSRKNKILMILKNRDMVFQRIPINFYEVSVSFISDINFQMDRCSARSVVPLKEHQTVKRSILLES